jgi:broad specificity phosphatase PhoE
MHTSTHSSSGLDHPLGDGRAGARRDESIRLFVVARHAESSANIAGVVSSDPARSVGLTARGRAQARRLGAQLAYLNLDLAVCTSFLRTQETLRLALRGRRVPVLIDRGFDEVRAGDFDTKPIEAYWSWEQDHARSDRFPRGESLDEALLRYADALRRLLSRTESVTLLVIHEFALRRISAAVMSRPPVSHASFGNALPFLFDERAIERAAAGLERSAKTDLAEPGPSARIPGRGETFASTGEGILPCPCPTPLALVRGARVGGGTTCRPNGHQRNRASASRWMAAPYVWPQVAWLTDKAR